MTEKAQQELMSDERIAEITKAKELLEQVEQEKDAQFFREYEELCNKHKRTINVNYQLIIQRM